MFMNINDLLDDIEEVDVVVSEEEIIGECDGDCSDKYCCESCGEKC